MVSRPVVPHFTLERKLASRNVADKVEMLPLEDVDRSWESSHNLICSGECI